MEQYSIGRGDDCRIRLADVTQRVSRNHATLKVMDNGKIFITDHSANGTYLNGIKISPNVDFPVKRGDSISFANVAELNWVTIPRKLNRTILYLMIGIAILATIILAVIFVVNSNQTPPDSTTIQLPDTSVVQQQKLDVISQKDTVKQEQDSIKIVEKEAVRQEPVKTQKKQKKPAETIHEEEDQSKPDSDTNSMETLIKQVF